MRELMTGTSPRANNLGSNESEITGRKKHNIIVQMCKENGRGEQEYSHVNIMCILL